MGLFHRIRVLWLGFWSKLISNSEGRNQTLVAEGAIQAQKNQLKKVRDALTNLIFQKKKLQDQVSSLDREVMELKTDVQQAASEDRDELAINLIARLESAQEEHHFLKDQLDLLEKDIELARDTESELQKEIIQAEQMLGALTSRHQALRVRRQLQTELKSVTSSVTRASNQLKKPLVDQIHRLEAEMETMQARRTDWEKEWQAMRSKRHQDRHQDILRQIKDNLRHRRALPVDDKKESYSWQ